MGVGQPLAEVLLTNTGAVLMSRGLAQTGGEEQFVAAPLWPLRAVEKTSRGDETKTEAFCSDAATWQLTCERSVWAPRHLWPVRSVGREGHGKTGWSKPKSERREKPLRAAPNKGRCLVVIWHQQASLLAWAAMHRGRRSTMLCALWPQLIRRAKCRREIVFLSPRKRESVLPGKGVLMTTWQEITWGRQLGWGEKIQQPVRIQKSNRRGNKSQVTKHTMKNACVSRTEKKFLV